MKDEGKLKRFYAATAFLACVVAENFLSYH